MGEFLFEVPLRGNVALLLTHLIPARYFVALLKGIYLKGIGLNILFMEAGLLSLFGVLMFALANVRFKKKLE